MNEAGTDIERLEGVIRRWNPTLETFTIVPITGDMSLRRYFRVGIGSKTPRTVVAMAFLSLVVPEATGKDSVDSYESYVLLTRYLAAHGLPVPAIYYESVNPHILLLEDLGDTFLADLLFSAGDRDDSRIRDYYSRAVEMIVRLQEIPARGSFFAFQRAFTPDVYVREMTETLDYVLRPLDIPSSRRQVFESAIEVLAEEVKSFPAVFALRDFHSWNLMIDPGGALRLIDFQDALMATSTYDLVSLLNDRDTDTGLGDELYRSIVVEFLEGRGGGDEIYAEYDRVLLQRDLKVAGRLSKMVSARGLEQYRRWVPGTLRRIGRTLERMVAARGERPIYTSLLEVLSETVPEVRRGVDEPLRLRTA